MNPTPYSRLSGDRCRCTSSWNALLPWNCPWRIVPTGPPLNVNDQTACGIVAVAIAGLDAATAAGPGDNGETGRGAGGVEGGALAAGAGGSIAAGGSAGGAAGASRVAMSGPT